MSSAYYELYLKDVFDFVGTMVIKSDVAAGAINNWLAINQYPIDKTRPETWKYYLNMSGVYHASDLPMTIRSLDTLQEIDMTVENLILHRNTRREYSYRSRYYNELVERFPDQEELIQGILNPVKIDDAVAAEDHTILYYDTSLVESGEIDLIYNLQLWINAFFTRWDVPDYSYTESLFTAAQLAVLYTFLPKQIINLRLANCKTDRAHSFHIKQYLTSFGRLDPYFDFMNNKQRLFFYRNIRHLNLNSGKNETFEKLTEKVMTDRYFPLAEYTIRHNTATLAEDLYPTIEMRRSSINGLSSALGEDIKSVREVLSLEQGLARSNDEFQDEAEIAIPRMMKNSLSSQLETKVLESNVLDKTDAEPFTLADVIFNHWIFYSTIGKYNTIFTVVNPNSAEDMYLTAKQMFILWLYVYNKAMGYELLVVPNLFAKRVKRSPMPSFAELRGITETRYIEDKLIHAALDNQPDIGSIISVDSFKDYCVSIHRAGLRHRDLAVYQRHFISRGQAEVMTDRFYMDYECNLADEMPYSVWLNELSLDFSKMSDKDLNLLASNIFALATGQNLVAVKSLQEIHTAHIRLMTQLSSYSVQFIQQINTSSLKIEDWTYVRMGDSDSKLYDGVKILIRPVTILDQTSYGKPKFYKDLVSTNMYNQSLYFKREEYIPLKVRPKVTVGGNGLLRHRLVVIENTIPVGGTIDLADISRNLIPFGYDAIPKRSFTEMFDSSATYSYVPLTDSEKENLIIRNL